jgi:hypothetical protein
MTPCVSAWYSTPWPTLLIVIAVAGAVSACLWPFLSIAFTTIEACAALGCGTANAGVSAPAPSAVASVSPAAILHLIRAPNPDSDSRSPESRISAQTT